MEKVETVPCEVCGKEFKGSYQDYLCCSGYQCGCMGKPTEPIVCSLWCLCYAYHIREGKLSVLKNYISTVWINTKLGRKIWQWKQNREFKKMQKRWPK